MAAISELYLRSILLSGRAGDRILNESVIDFRVWADYASDPQRTIDLLITPQDDMLAARLAYDLYFAIEPMKTSRDVLEVLSDREPEPPLGILPLQGVVAARLGFDLFLKVVLPGAGLDLAARFDELRALIVGDRAKTGVTRDALSGGVTFSEMMYFAERHRGELSPEMRTALAVALVLAKPLEKPERDYIFLDDAWFFSPEDPAFREPLDVLEPGRPQRFVSVPPLIRRVSVNRPVEAMGMSVQTIKADAAQRVFDVDCGALTWAVIDSGIDGSHPAFLDHGAGGNAIRVDKAYDFGRLRRLASYDSLLGAELSQTLARVQDVLVIDQVQALAFLQRLQADAMDGRPFDWKALSALLETAPDSLPDQSDGRPNGHGTHVAGVLAGDWREGGKVIHQGVCPTMRLYDLRVLGDSPTETEFAVIAALEFVRWLNGETQPFHIHGVNLSIGIKHELASYACGRTPVCVACDATVARGVVVVAAAGNWGSHVFTTENGPYQGYAAMSISDPGNAASVITVGSTHRERPHEYGVSFFSSRGPTGDGRSKPDVVAPGEKIDGPFPNLGFGRLDGTSMAAPHVSGVAAMLMARHNELIGDPATVKKVIMDTATCLGRERHFQGAGLVDALRALGSR